MTKELKPCAHCGGEGQLKITYSVWRGQSDKPISFEPHCDKFGCQGSTGLAYATEEAAIESWNTRTLEIVWCEECVYYSGETYGECELDCDSEQDDNIECETLWNKEDFCSYGERRGEK